MMNMFFLNRRKKRKKNAAALGGIVSASAIIGGITWYAARKMKHSSKNHFIHLQDEEGQL